MTTPSYTVERRQVRDPRIARALGLQWPEGHRPPAVPSTYEWRLHCVGCDWFGGWVDARFADGQTPPGVFAVEAFDDHVARYHSTDQGATE